MTGYTLHVTQPGGETTAELETLDDLTARIALEQLLHELNPLDPAGYTVGFVVTGDADKTSATESLPVADGHFYVRPAWCVVAPVETGNSPN